MMMMMMMKCSATQTGVDDVVLSLISVIGCTLSVIALLLTIVVYAIKWKYVTSTPT